MSAQVFASAGPRKGRLQPRWGGTPGSKLRLEPLEERVLLALSAATSLHLDFGIKNSPAELGYVHAPLEVYEPGLGFGWETTAGLSAFDRRAGGVQNPLDSLNRDLHMGERGTFLADLVDGAYDVTVLLGDARYPRDHVSVWAEDQLAAGDVSTAAGEFLPISFPAVVSDGQLKLQFIDHGGVNVKFSVAGLDIVPSSTPPPVVDAGPDQAANEGQPLTLAGSASGAAPLSYTWNFGDGATASGTLSPSHTFADNGVFTVTLTVRDGLGRSQQDTMTVTVGNVAPTALPGGPYSGSPGAAIGFSGAASDPSTSDVAAGFSYSWDFGDGTSSSQRNPLHAYAAAGSYVVTLTVTDKDGSTASASTTAAVGTTIVTPHDTIPNFGDSPTITTARSGAWSSTSTWSLGRLPAAGDVVSVEAGHTVTYDLVNTAQLKTVAIQAGGKLQFRTDINTRLTVQNLLVLEGGTLEVGTAASPVAVGVKAEIVIANLPLDTVLDPEQYGNGLIALGKVTMHGATRSASFVRLAAEPLAGHTTLTLAEPVSGWQVGDKLALPDTRHLKRNEIWSNYAPQWELATIQSISADPPGAETLTLASPLQFAHIGARDGNGVLEFLPHVANLTRNVVVRSESATGTRGHAMFAHRAEVDIRYAHFADPGRTTNADIDNTTFDSGGAVTHIGANQTLRYPVHFHHLIGPAGGAPSGYQYIFLGNSVTGDLDPTPVKWGLAVHDSHYGLIQDNVLYNWAGAGIVTEDGNESYNVFERNMVLAIRGDQNPRQNDGRDGSAYWFAGWNNYIRDNVASAGVGSYQGIVSGSGYNLYTPPVSKSGFRIPLFPGADLTISGQYQVIQMRNTPILEFARNEVYGATAVGLTIWHLGTTGYQSQPMAESIVRDFRAWHVHDEGFFGYPINHVTFDGFVVRGHSRALSNIHTSHGWRMGDYWSENTTIRRADIQGMTVGIGSSWNTPGVFTIEDSYFRNYLADIRVETLASPGSGAPTMPRRTEIRNSRFDRWGNSSQFYTIEMLYNPNRNRTNLIQTDEVFVYDYNQMAGDTFRLYYLEQRPDFVVPQSVTTGPVLLTASPEAGLTNLENWNQYGIAVAGEIAYGTTTRTVIHGLVK